MSARIVYALLRSEPMDADALEDSATMPQAAENSRRDIRGQLWQRLAEVSMTTVNLANVTDEQADRMHAVLYSAERFRLSRDPDDPNQRVRMFGRYQKLAAGRIRAGVRVK